MKGDRREALLDYNMAMVGYFIRNMVGALVGSGLATPSFDDKEEDKERRLHYERN